jgi:hypothetical protein
VDYLKDPRAADFVFGMAVQFSGNATPDGLGFKTPSEGAVPAVVAGSLLTRIETFRRVGPFSSTWRVGEFIDWFARAEEMGLTSHVMDRVVLLRRLHAANLGRQDNASRVDFTRILRAKLDRRRREGLT